MSPTLHDATKVLLGNVGDTDKDISVFDGDPATFPAGTGLRLKSDGTLSKASSGAGRFLGVSLGRSLSDHKKVSICRVGNYVPLLMTLKYATGSITITSYANLVAAGNDTITVAGIVFTAGSGAATPGAATFQAATSNAATRDSLLAQINAHAGASALVVATALSTAGITITSILPGLAGNAYTLVVTDNGTATVGATVSGAVLSGGAVPATPGLAVYINDTTGLGDVSSGSTITGAVYVSGLLTGVLEDGTTAPVALIDMGGGL